MSDEHQVAPARHTVSYLTRRFREAGIRPVTKYGQNFLVDLNLVRLLADTAELDERDVVLEVGTGTGSLTALLARRSGAVVTVEVDPQMHRLAQEELMGADHITMLRQDALRNKNNLHPAVLEAVRQRLAEAPRRRLKLAANLPYNIATPIVSNLLSTDVTPVLMAVTIQRELAERIVARPATKDYGALSVWVQSQCRAEIVRELPPSVFWPRPKVHSAIMRIEPVDELREAIADRAFFHRFVRSMFFHRRKFLRSVAISAFKGRLDKPAVDQVLSQLQLGREARTEQLSVPRILEMSEAFRRRLAEEGGGAEKWA